MKTLSEKLTLFFKNAEKLHLVHHASSQNSVKSRIDTQALITYLNPIHPYPLHLVSTDEITYLNTLTEIELKELIKQLNNNNAQYLIFKNQKDIPAAFFEQEHIHLVINDNPVNNLQQLSQEINEFTAERVSQPGTFVVVFNQGILITGESGSGKSSLLLNLVKQGHLWIADDAVMFHLDRNHPNNKITGHAFGELSEFIHVKGIGPINLDKCHGQASRIRFHPLAAVIHLSNNRNNENKELSAYTQLDKFSLFNTDFPMWHFSSTQPNLLAMVESCARNLILNDWNYSTINGLENALKNALTKNEANTKAKLKKIHKPSSTRPA